MLLLISTEVQNLLTHLEFLFVLINVFPNGNIVFTYKALKYEQILFQPI